MYRLFRLDPGRIEHRNAFYLVVEMFWASMLAAAATFNAAFAIRLGATNAEISLLTSVPALVAVIVSIPAGRFLQKKAHRKPWLLWTLFFYRAGFLLVALVPWLPDLGIPKGLLLVLILVMISPPAHFFNVGFIPLLSEVVPAEMRASVFSARNIFYNLVLSACGFLFGIWLDRVAFPANYQSLYLFGFLCSMLSLYYLARVDVPDSIVATPSAPGKRKLMERLQAASLALGSHPGFLRITVNTLLHGIGVWMALPLYVLFFVRQLGATEAWLGINGTVASMATIAGFALWRWIIIRRGEPTILRLTIVCVGLYPVAVGLLGSLPLILVATALNGLLVPGVNLSHLNTLLKVTPENERPGYTAIYMTAANIGAFICPLLGVAAAEVFGLAPTLIACGVLSILGSTSFWLWPVVPTSPTPALSINASGIVE
jgi:MFS family permease